MYRRNDQGWRKHADFIIWDAFTLQIAYILAYMLRQGKGLPYIVGNYFALAVVYAVVDVFIGAVFNTMHNVMKRGYYLEAVQTGKQVVLVLVVVSLYMFSLQSGEDFSRIVVFLTAGFHFILGYAFRYMWKAVVRKHGRRKNKFSMILVADERQVPMILRQMRPTDYVEYTGIVLSNRDGTGEQIDGVPVVAGLETASDYICKKWVDEVFFYPEQLSDIEVPESMLNKDVERFIYDSFNEFAKKSYKVQAKEQPREKAIVELIEACRQMAVPMHIRLPIFNVGEKGFIEKVGGYNVLTVTANYASPAQLALKRAMDILGGMFGSVVALVIMAVVGPIIKRESPGPILFKQTRIGKNGKTFIVTKILTSKTDKTEPLLAA